MKLCTKVVSVDVEQYQEEVAKTISRYSLLAVPVVNKENRLLGIVTVDDAMEIMEEEDTEDIHKMAGITPEEDIELSKTIWGASKKNFMACYLSNWRHVCRQSYLWVFSCPESMVALAFLFQYYGYRRQYRHSITSLISS